MFTVPRAARRTVRRELNISNRKWEQGKTGRKEIIETSRVRRNVIIARHRHEVNVSVWSGCDKKFCASGIQWSSRLGAMV